ncbi:hypothetical protein [Streptomyces sp. NPDC086182]|uniref:hypothetical protein n=1 Tax=Streptomyces sp. NPDC086182 TaxID=3155058 RepID=UPI00344ABFE6
MTQRTIISSSVETTPRGPVVGVAIDVGIEGVKPVLHLFPLDTLEWRAAEYGIDHTDIDQLLDIVLHEPYITDEAVVHTAASAEAARIVHLERIAAVKAAGHALAPGAPGRKTDPLQPVRDAYAQFADEDEVAAKARSVEQHRAAVRARPRKTAAAGWARRPIGNYTWPELKEASRA